MNVPSAHQQSVAALADFVLARRGVGLALLVEGHDDDCGAIALAEAGLVQEVLLAVLEADGVDDALALNALEPGLQHRSEEHTSELQSRGHLVCRLLLEKKKKLMQSLNTSILT